MDIRPEDYAGLLIDTVSAIIVGLDLEGRVIFFNRGAEEITGYRAEDARGRPWFELVVPRDRYPEVWASFQRATSTTDLAEYYENAIQTASGEERIILWRNTPLRRGGDMVGTLSLGLDVTERRAAESRARAWEAQFRRLIEAAPEMIGVIRDGRLIYANRTLARSVGRERVEELVGRPVADIVHPDDRQQLHDRHLESMNSDTPPPVLQYRMVRADGTTFTAEWTSIRVDFEGAAAQLGFGRDITDRQRIEAQLAQAERMATVGSLTAGIAHEINNPLTYLSLNVDMLFRLLPQLRSGADCVDEVEHRLAEIRDATARVTAIIRDLRTFSRIAAESSGKVDLGEVVRGGLKLVQNELRHRAQLEVAIADDVPAVVGDEGRLVQIVINLITNALQALPDGDPADSWVRVEVAPEGGGVVLSVSDSGSGIDPAIADRIFEPFFTTKPLGQGTGLGLSIVDGLVRQLGGNVRVERPGPRGATFRVWLPAAPAEPRDQAPAIDPAGAASPRSLSVLVVDDEALIGRAVQAAFSPPHDVCVVTRAEDGLAALGHTRFDVVLCDLMMPGMSGMDFYEEVQRRAPAVAARFVFMTGGTFTQRATEFLAAVELPRIEKPFDLDDLDRLLVGLSASRR